MSMHSSLLPFFLSQERDTASLTSHMELPNTLIGSSKGPARANKDRDNRESSSSEGSSIVPHNDDGDDVEDDVDDNFGAPNGSKNGSKHGSKKGGART